MMQPLGSASPTHATPQTLLLRPHGALQRARIAQWQAASALAVAAGMFALAAQTSLAYALPSLVVLFAFLTVPLAIARLCTHIHWYTQATAWCIVGVLADLSVVLLLYPLIANHPLGLLGHLQALLTTAVFAMPMVGASMAQAAMAAALYHLVPTQPPDRLIERFF